MDKHSISEVFSSVCVLQKTLLFTDYFCIFVRKYEKKEETKKNHIF